MLNSYENIVEKTKKFAEKVERKIKINEVLFIFENILNEKEKIINFEKEMKNCTFSPKINKKSKLVKSTSCDDFYRKQIGWKKKIDFFNFKKANDPYINIEVNLFSQVYFKNSLRKI